MKGHSSVWLGRTLFLAATATFSVAAEESKESAVQLSNVVVSAAGYEQKLVEAPASISVITAEELRSRPYTTLLDAVRYLEGVDVGETRDKSGQGTISIRGMGSDYTLVLINGRRQNNHGDLYPNSFGGNQLRNIPPLDAIERIEVIRGPASTLYGADAMGGVINIITKPVTDSWSGSVTHSRTFQEQSEYGDEHTTDLFLSGPIVRDALGLSLRGSFYNSDASNPVFDPVYDLNGVAHNRSLGFGGGGKTVDNEHFAVGGTLTWTPAANQRVSFDIDTYRQTYDNETRTNDSGVAEYPLGTVDSIDTIWLAGNACHGAVATTSSACVAAGGTWGRRANPRVGYADEQEFQRDSISVTHEGKWDFGNSFVSLQRVTTNNNGRTLPFTVAERDQLLQMIDAQGAYAGMSLEDRKAAAEAAFLPRPKRTMESDQIVLDAKVDMPLEMAGAHTLVVGTQVIRGELTDGVFGMEKGTTGEKQSYNMWSLFAEDTWYIWSPFALTAGLRYDNHEDFGDHLSPRLYAVYNLTSDWTIKGGVSTGFKTPKTTQLYDGVIGFGGQGTSPMYGNPDLKPETSVSKEVAVYWQHPQENHNVNVTVFQNTFADKLSSQPCGAGTSYTCSDSGDYLDIGYGSSSKTVNIDEVELQGVEVAGRIQLLDSVGLSANYTYTDSEQKSGAEKGQPYGNVAKHMANATLDWQLFDQFGLFLTLESRDKRYRSWDAVADKALYYKGYEVLHLGFKYDISRNVVLNGRINNLLDLDFTDYETTFADCILDNSSSGNAATCLVPAGSPNGTAGYVATHIDSYNNKDMRRNYWLSLNVKF